jgi:ent-kaurene oxidase
MFKVSRNDGDILILSNKYVDELRGLPEENLSAILAHQHVGEWISRRARLG